MSDQVPEFARRAAERLYAAMESIDGEAQNDGQIDQDPASEKFTWTRLVAAVIAEEFRSKRRRAG